MNSVDQLVAGYATYTDAADLGASAASEAPATTPAILSWVAVSTAACGAAVSAVSAASVGVTIEAGC